MLTAPKYILVRRQLEDALAELGLEDGQALINDRPWRHVAPLAPLLRGSSRDGVQEVLCEGRRALQRCRRRIEHRRRDPAHKWQQDGLVWRWHAHAQARAIVSVVGIVLER